MKVGIVGTGAAGAAATLANVLRGRVRELVLVNRDRARARAVARDVQTPRSTRRSSRASRPPRATP